MCKSIFSKLKKNKIIEKRRKRKATHSSKAMLQLAENMWYKKKIEKELGIPFIDNTKFTALEKDLTRKAGSHLKKRVEPPYYQPPQTADNPNIAWNGPRLKPCFCISSMDRCNCSGRMVLPNRSIPYAMPTKMIPWLRLFSKLPCFINKRFDELHKLEQPLAVRLKDRLEIEEEVFRTLTKMNRGMDRSSQFCVMRCNGYNLPLGKASDKYFYTKRKLYIDILQAREEGKLPPKPRPPPPPRPVGLPKISASFTEGLYRSGPTQAIFDKDGNFVFGKYSRFLFGKNTRFQDVEGKDLIVRSYQKINKPPEKPQTVLQQVENKLNQIKAKVSKLTVDFVTSIIVIKDPGIPVCTRATQDPPLDDEYESMILPTKYKCVKVLEKESCLCHKKYEATHYSAPTKSDVAECMNLNEEVVSENSCTCLPDALSSVIDEVKEDLRSCDDESIVMKEGLYSPVTCERRNLDGNNGKDIEKIKDDDNTNIIEKQDVTKEEKDINENDSKPETTAMYQIFSEDSKISLESLTKTSARNNIDDFKMEIEKISLTNINARKQGSGVHAETAEPIDKLCNHLEQNVAIDKYVITLLEEIIFSGIDRSMDLPIRKQGQQLTIKHQKSSDEGIYNKIKDFFLKSIVDSVLPNFNSDTKEKNASKTDFNRSLKPNSNINKFSRTKKAFSMENAKLNINKSFKKANSMLLPLFKYRREKSSEETNDILNLKKKSENINQLNDTNKDNLEGDVDLGQNVSESKTSEKEVFSVQYYSSLDMSNKSDN